MVVCSVESRLQLFMAMGLVFEEQCCFEGTTSCGRPPYPTCPLLKLQA